MWSVSGTIYYQMYLQTKSAQYLTYSLNSYIKGITFANNTFPFALSIITHLFKRGNKDMYNLFMQNYKNTPPFVWVYLMPQIQSKLNTKDSDLRNLLEELIYWIVVNHPNATL